MSNHYEWLMQPIDIQFLQKPKPIPSLPFKQIWVIDNYLPASIHDSWYESRFNTTKWGRQNRVIRNNKMRHLYWGESIYINISERGWETNGIERKYEKRNLNSSRWKYQADWKQNVASQQRIGYRNAVIDWFIHIWFWYVILIQDGFHVVQCLLNPTVITIDNHKRRSKV